MNQSIIKGVGFIFIFCALISFGGQDKDKNHSDTCPKDCKICKGVFERGLDFLASKQNKKGYWEDKEYSRAATTSLCCLAFLAEGSTLKEGKYKENIERGLKYILEKCCKKDGRIDGAQYGGPDPQATSVAVILLSELYRRGKEPKIREVIEKSIKFIEKCQAKGKSRGWGYYLTLNNQVQYIKNHTGTMYTVLFSLLSAKSAGMEVSDKTISDGVECLISLIKGDGGVLYKEGEAPNTIAPLGEGTLARPGAVLSILQRVGKADNPKAKKLTGRLLKNKKAIFDKLKKDYDPHFHHALIFATVAFYKINGNEWQDYYSKFRDLLLKAQKKDGSWIKKTTTNTKIESWYQTAQNLIMLCLPLGNIKTLE